MQVIDSDRVDTRLDGIDRRLEALERRLLALEGSAPAAPPAPVVESVAAAAAAPDVDAGRHPRPDWPHLRHPRRRVSAPGRHGIGRRLSRRGRRARARVRERVAADRGPGGRAEHACRDVLRRLRSARRHAARLGSGNTLRADRTGRRSVASLGPGRTRPRGGVAPPASAARVGRHARHDRRRDRAAHRNASLRRVRGRLHRARRGDAVARLRPRLDSDRDGRPRSLPTPWCSAWPAAP